MKTADGFRLLLVRQHTHTQRKKEVAHNESHTSRIITDSSLSEVLSAVITVITAIEGHFL